MIFQALDYNSVSEAITGFRKQGYLVDFNLLENSIVCESCSDKFKLDEMEIVHVYRYEGNSDPADEAVVYAIESKTGINPNSALENI
jgi:hypothetical protein